jgi:hypothetical protein
MTVNLEQLQTWDDHLQAMVDLAEAGDSTLWDRGDVMLHALPIEHDKRGRPVAKDEDLPKLGELAAAAEMSRSFGNAVYLTSAFYENGSREPLIDSRTPWVWAREARNAAGLRLSPPQLIELILDARARGEKRKDFIQRLRAGADSEEYPDWLQAGNVWPGWGIESWQIKYERPDGSGGQVSGKILLNILHQTTTSGDLVIDPMAGAGNMLAASKQMPDGKRSIVMYDLRPREGIRSHDARESFPDRGAQLVYVDPPYWDQKSYSEDANDLGNMDLPEFHAALEKICSNGVAALKSGGYLVLIIGSTQKGRSFHDHALEMAKRIKGVELVNRVIARYPGSQYNAMQVIQAKKMRKLLNWYTTILFWRKS